MYARVTMVTGGSPDQAEQGIANFRDNALAGVKELGARGGMLLIDRQSGEGMAVTLWEDEAAMQASEEQANELRRAALQALGSTEEPRVERYEVAVFETG
jgi:heme-degrading monooxygenase HmoA